MNTNEITKLDNDFVDESFDNDGLNDGLVDNNISSNSSIGKRSSPDRSDCESKGNSLKDNANSLNIDTDASRFLAVSNKQGKSILENFLTRPLSVPFQGLSMSNSMDNRKVEPLKINLHRDPIKTVIKIPPSEPEPQQHSPKVIIKPLKPPLTIQVNTDFDGDHHLYKSQNKNSYETNDCSKSNIDLHTEPHIVPKLTIRNISHQTPTSVLSSLSTSNECSSSTDSFHAIVPKLTIKIDHQNSQEFNTHQSSKSNEKKSKQEEGMLTADGVKLTIKPIPEPPIPKLTIKTTPSDATITSNSCDVMQLPSIPKLLIKSIQPDTIEKEHQSASDENDSNEKSIEAIENLPIPKVTLKTNSVSSESSPTIPKLILKMGGNKIVCRDDTNQCATEIVIENNQLYAEKKLPEHALTQDLQSESDKIKFLVENSESKNNTEKVTDLHPSELLTAQNIAIKQQSNAKASTIHENPDSARIILKINKSSTSEMKSITEQTLTSNIKKEKDLKNFVSSSNTSELEFKSNPMAFSKTDSPDFIENADSKKGVKRTKSDVDDDKEIVKVSSKRINFSKDFTECESSRMIETIISEDDTNYMRIESQNKDKKEQHTKENYVKPEPVCITINDDSTSSEKQEPNDDITITTTEINQAIHNILIIEDQADTTTPVKRGRGRPKKILQTLTTKKISKEMELNEKTDTSRNENLIEQKGDVLKTPTRGKGKRSRGGKTIEVVKDGKVLQVKMDAGYEDDDSPTFTIYNRYATTRGRGRGGRGKRVMGRIKKPFSFEGPSSSFDPSKTPNNFADLKVTNKKLIPKTNNALQIFEEDTLMGGDIFQTPYRNLPEFPDDSQSSQLSSASATNEARERKRGKMEVCEPEGRTEFTVDMIAEYEWPPFKHGQKHRTSETYMVQEQISEYLGIKSFKRKYPDLVRRPVEMEERNFMMERGLVSEKMCDLGLTAVIASEILDIMCNDYPEKYEEYRRYQREKQFLEFSHRQRLLRFEQENKGQQQKDKAIETAASWNAMFNKERLQSRKNCIDLQTLIIHIPKSKSEKLIAQSKQTTTKTNYPISLVPGQFSEFFKSYSAEELACYPVNTVLIHHTKLDALLKEQEKIVTSDESGNESEDYDSSPSESDSTENTSSSDEEIKNVESDPLCAVCDLTQYKNSYGYPEIFIECTTCHRKAHPTCIKMPLKMVKRVMEYNWKCAECKNCTKCIRTTDESKMLFCGQCDRGYHIYCLGLRNVPDGQWYCNICTICTKCGTKNPEGNPNPLLTPDQRQNLATIANWTHSFRINHITKMREHHQTLCVPCARLNYI